MAQCCSVVLQYSCRLVGGNPTKAVLGRGRGVEAGSSHHKSTVVAGTGWRGLGALSHIKAPLQRQCGCIRLNGDEIKLTSHVAHTF